ncbi:MAG: porin family protein [Alphaproteobacteria bacterium]|nr:porin family protein [Alphaproteobacteria bacterium]
MKLLRSTFALISLVWLSLSAHAAGEPPRFDGIYGGFVSGYGFVDQGSFVLNNNTTHGFDLEGPLAGLTGGWNWNHGAWLLGLEADGQALGMQDTITCNGGCNVTADIDGLITARGRVGYLFGDDQQIAAYATGGLALVWLGVRNNGGAPPLSTEWTEVTYAVGGGIEGYLFGTDWMSSKLEYLYVGLDAKRTALVNTADSGRYKFEGMHLIRWGLNIHFN